MSNKPTTPPDSGRARLTRPEVEVATFMAEIKSLLDKGLRLPEGHDEFVEQYYAVAKFIRDYPQSVAGFTNQLRLMRDRLANEGPQSSAAPTEKEELLIESPTGSAAQSSDSEETDDTDNELEEIMRKIDDEQLTDEEMAAETTRLLIGIQGLTSKLKHRVEKMSEMTTDQIQGVLNEVDKLQTDLKNIEKDDNLSLRQTNTIRKLNATFDEMATSAKKLIAARSKTDPILAEARTLLDTLTKRSDRNDLTVSKLKNELADLTLVANKFPRLFLLRLIEVRDKIMAAVEKAEKSHADQPKPVAPIVEAKEEIQAQPKEPDVHDVVLKQLNAKVLASNQILGKVLNKLSVVEIAELADRTKDMLFELQKWKNNLPDVLPQAAQQKYDRSVKNLNTFIKIIDAKKGEPMLASAVNRVLSISNQFANPDEKVRNWVQDLGVEVRTINMSDRYQDCNKQRLAEDLQSIAVKDAPKKVHTPTEMKAFEAIEKLSNLLKRVEAFKNVPLISSYLKGQVKEQLKVLNQPDIQAGLSQLAGPGRDATLQITPNAKR